MSNLWVRYRAKTSAGASKWELMKLNQDPISEDELRDWIWELIPWYEKDTMHSRGFEYVLLSEEELTKDDLTTLIQENTSAIRLAVRSIKRCIEDRNRLKQKLEEIRR